MESLNQDDLTTAIVQLVAAQTDDAQLDAVTRYYHPLATLSHPLLEARGHAEIAAVYRWWRALYSSPRVTAVELLTILNLSDYTATLVARVVQEHHTLPLFIFGPTRPRLELIAVVDVVRINNGHWVFLKQADHYAANPAATVILPRPVWHGLRRAVAITTHAFVEFLAAIGFLVFWRRLVATVMRE
ncbi:hypothetical protein H9P43_006837 [Blastocladiella emersonii ATCC 22665]|nr:hypothetical protein H9P43_006837 [Blastocladiella emersonii ATCC 22665]